MVRGASGSVPRHAHAYSQTFAFPRNGQKKGSDEVGQPQEGKLQGTEAPRNGPASGLEYVPALGFVTTSESLDLWWITSFL